MTICDPSSAKLRTFTHSQRALFEVALAENAEAFVEPMDEAKVEEIVTNLWRYYAPSADSPESQPSADWRAEIERVRGDGAGVVAVVHRLVKDSALSLPERDALLKHAADAAGCTVKAVRAEVGRVLRMQGG